MKARDLTRRTVRGVSAGIVDDEIVAAGLNGEVAVHSARLEPPVALRVFLETRQRRLEFVLYGRIELGARAASTPLQAIQLVEIEQREHFVQRNVCQPER